MKIKIGCWFGIVVIILNVIIGWLLAGNFEMNTFYGFLGWLVSWIMIAGILDVIAIFLAGTIRDDFD